MEKQTGEKGRSADRFNARVRRVRRHRQRKLVEQFGNRPIHLHRPRGATTQRTRIHGNRGERGHQRLSLPQGHGPGEARVHQRRHLQTKRLPRNRPHEVLHERQIRADQLPAVRGALHARRPGGRAQRRARQRRRAAQTGAPRAACSIASNLPFGLQVLARGVGLSTHSDSELITQALCLIPPDGEVNGPDWPARIKHLMRLAPLSYSLCLMLKDRIYAVRDPYGNRPLCLGIILPSDHDPISNEINGYRPEGWVVSSESCAFMLMTRYLREVLPGEIVEMTNKGVRTIDIVPPPENNHLAFCIFEYVYFARPNSQFEGQEVYSVRVHCGMQLAVDHPVEADVVGSIPESGNAAAFGYSTQSGIPLGELLTKNSYVGRTFIQPNNRLRQMNVSLKFSPILRNVSGKRIILIDDSIVRGNTVGPIIKLLRRAGAKEIHIRVASPPLKYPCFMGINIPTRSELIMNKLKDTREFAKIVDADSIEYLSVNGLVKAVHKEIKPAVKPGHCTACLTGDYPGGLPEELDW
ncbi:unnamed protein product [Phyllotreta striolata]|uniref:Amidophosphoribosyltransferase n=1 Tax=Phyllotreta striolata TaxID=444603 RepID=A0A9N9TK04_PHYSR|nr:unnamed protein product [Phyllotreta striolata]